MTSFVILVVDWRTMFLWSLRADGHLKYLAVEMLKQVGSGEAYTDIGSRVRFSAHNIFLPNQEEAESLASGDDEFEGVISGFSDSGGLTRAYAVVEVIRRLSFVVPVPDLRLVTDSDPNAFNRGS